MMLTEPKPSRQLPLLHIVHADDLHLEQQADVLWFDVLRRLDYRPLQPIAAKYYEALAHFNQQQAEAREAVPAPPNAESKDEATQRLLFARATLTPLAPVIFTPPAPPDSQLDPESLRPGVTPLRFAGRPPKCCFALLKAFLGVMLAGESPEPEFVYKKLVENPAFVRSCGFTLPNPNGVARASDYPSLRKLQQFDQLMTEYGLWSELSRQAVLQNLRSGRVSLENTVVHDTTHYYANSSMQVVELREPTVPTEADATAETSVPTPASSLDSPSSAGTDAEPCSAAVAPCPAEATRPDKLPKPEKRQKQPRKSHPRTTKACRCDDRDHCPHPWINADDGAGTVVKSRSKMYWAHKASTLSFADQEVLLDAVAVSDAATHDSQTLEPHLKRLLTRFPELEGVVTRVLDDGAADDEALKARLQADQQIELLTPINPRARRPITEDLPRGIAHLTPLGTPVCHAGFPFDYVTLRRDTERFVFRAPLDAQGLSVCQGCALRPDCYRGESGARQVTIAQTRLPWLNPAFPQLSQRYATAMARRTVIERLHKQMKYDLGSDQLTKRGNASFQARLDKTLFAMHILLAA